MALSSLKETLEPTKLLQELREHLQRYVEEAPLVASFDPTRPRVRLHEPTYGIEEIWEALESLLTTRVTMGEKVRRFENAFAAAFRFPHALMVNSGSSANLLALSALTNPACPARLQPGDEVIVPALSWSTTVWPIIQMGLTPVIVDIDPSTLNIDPNDMQRAISPKTKAVMLVHVYGNPCDMTAITDLARRHDLTLIEDCCEALGASFGGRSVGSFGRVGTFSFYFSHHITTLEGGMCVTADQELAELMRILRAHGWVRECADPARYTQAHPEIHPRFLFVNLGYNLRATELQGGFGVPQLKKLQGFLEIRMANARFWQAALDDVREFFDVQQETPGGTHSWFGFPMTVKASAPFAVGALTQFLHARGIETRPIIAGNIAAQPALRFYRHRVVGDLAHATQVMQRGFAFGNHQGIGPAARAYVAEVLHEFAREQKGR